MLTGLSYTTDVIISVSAGIVASTTICSPLLVLDGVAQNSNDSFLGRCMGNVGTKVITAANPGLGKDVNETTKNWSCPNIDHIADGLIKVAECYEQQGDERKTSN